MTSQQPADSPTDRVARVGGWLFRHRTSLPLPLVLALLVFPSPARLPSPSGFLLVALGEGVRLWAVRHVGAISRTRSDRLGPLVTTGPFAYVRNPLYLGNIAIWTGFALSAWLPWLALVAFVVLGAEYHAIVRWEEQLLDARRGEEYRAYAARVPRWIPKSIRRDRRERGEQFFSASSAGSVVAFSWSDTLFSERGTLVAIAAGYLLLWLKLWS